MTRILFTAFLCTLSATLAAAVNGEWRVNLLRGSSTIATVTADSEQGAWSACQARIAAQPAGSSTYTCQTARYVATVAADPVPPVNCATSAWSDWQAGQWSSCTNSTQSRTETRTRTVTTQPANGGTTCPALSETRTVSQACTVVDPVPPNPGETVGTWSQRDFARPFRINMEPGSYPVWVAGGATHQNLAGSWDGGRFARITPPTSVQTYGGIGAFPLSGSVSTLSLRWEMRAGPTYASGGQSFDDNKHVIIHTSSGNRAMMNIQSAGGNCLQMAIAQGTVKQFNQRAVGGNPAGWFRGENNDVFRWCDTASHAKAIPAGEWLSIEIQVSCATTLHASGHIRAIVHRRTSAKPLADWWIPWNYDESARCTNFTSIEGIGDYYNGRGNGAAGTYFDIAGVTIATNRAQPLGPRSGFVQ